MQQPLDVLLTGAQQIDALSELTEPLLRWYKQNARSLPWREDPTPYHVWISEIMLQQTRVEAVKGYYTRFLIALPDIQSLANAEEDTLLKLWEGLGYYNRVRNLQKAAQTVLRQFDGQLPASYTALLTLPGIGEYTAGAIASIAFGIPVPAVDGNVLRVMSRVVASYADISLPNVKAAYRQLLLSIIPPRHAGDFNQSLMELGATVCLPKGAPLCAQCPVSSLCAARQSGCAEELPVKAPKKARRLEERTVVLVLSQGKVLLFRRGDGLLGGMFEPLNLEGHLDVDKIQENVKLIGGSPQKIIPLRESKHIFTHVEWRMQAALVVSSPFAAPENALWAGSRALAEDYALPSAFRAYTKELPLWLEKWR